MKTYRIIIDNVKCGGCQNTITKAIAQIEGIESFEFDETTSTLTYHSDLGENQIAPVVEKKLKKLGYPKAGTGSGFDKAKSYVSCAIGRVNA